MNKLRRFSKGIVAALIMVVGVYFVKIYLTEPFGLSTLVTGGIGFLILYPAFEKWEEILPW